MRPTYKEQEKHLHEQYIAGLVHPYNSEFCFCGNLKGQRNRQAIFGEDPASLVFWPTVTYSMRELSAMEEPLLNIIWDKTEGVQNEKDHPNYELALFNGMVAALEVLKEVHRSWGEDVDGVVEFERRGEIA